MDAPANLPVAVIGAGPIGLAAAAHLAERGIKVKVYEAGKSVGANILDWGHVRIFTTWEQSVDAASRRLLERHGWMLPRPAAPPTGAEIVRDYLRPLAAVPELGGIIETDATVIAISRAGLDKVTSKARASKPFELRIVGADGKQRIDLARAVIDASGTWQNPNPLGASGLKIPGEEEAANRIAYGMPDVLGTRRADYAGKRVAVVGGGYSAINVLLDLIRLAREAPGTQAIWVVRGTDMNRIYGGGPADQLEARGALGTRLRQSVEQGRIQLVTGFRANALRQQGDGLELVGATEAGDGVLPPVERIVVATGQRPDLDMTRELRLELDPWLESVKALGPLIDPNLHSCGSVPPHGHRETAHPEPGFYTIGVKSYGRAPTFLLLTGYEQARSVAAALAGDLEAADDVHLVLPETGICSTDGAADAAGCCGGPAPAGTGACCVTDVVAKSAGKSGCGCGEAA
ncbi:FAD-dependent oxidoreductase [Dongia sp.]|uniref:FAD-dependent oxidoreductase n=1 Tax=Dongia sp. TaxID=1977262 RepID=UPI0035AFE83D